MDRESPALSQHYSTANCAKILVCCRPLTRTCQKQSLYPSYAELNFKHVFCDGVPNSYQPPSMLLKFSSTVVMCDCRNAVMLPWLHSTFLWASKEKVLTSGLAFPTAYSITPNLATACCVLQIVRRAGSGDAMCIACARARSIQSLGSRQRGKPALFLLRHAAQTNSTERFSRKTTGNLTPPQPYMPCRYWPRVSNDNTAKIKGNPTETSWDTCAWALWYTKCIWTKMTANAT